MVGRFAKGSGFEGLSLNSFIRVRFTWMALLGSALCLGGCGVLVRDTLVHSYMGIPFDASETSPEIAELARQAWAGSGRAQLQLGEKFEHGDGVEMNPDKALLLYELAARPTRGLQVYQSGLGTSVMSSVLTAADAEVEVRALARSRLNKLKSIAACEAIC